MKKTILLERNENEVTHKIGLFSTKLNAERHAKKLCKKYDYEYFTFDFTGFLINDPKI